MYVCVCVSHNEGSIKQIENSNTHTIFEHIEIIRLSDSQTERDKLSLWHYKCVYMINMYAN